ncbi:MAG: tRNA (adenosine(37)-N6)-threonylcarbamoyltransferase complex dimerization subunit type 1 TsaB [Rhodospirillales bacterium]
MTDGRTLLALDTATGACSVAVAAGGVIAARLYREMRRGQSEHLIGMIEAVMAESGHGFPDLDGIIVTRGPGAFTGLRIGIATARAVGLACGTPVFGMTTTEVIAAGVRRLSDSPVRVLAAVDGRRAEPYVQMFDADGMPCSEIIAATADNIAEVITEAPFILAGDGCDRAVPLLPRAPLRRIDVMPDAAEMALLADRRRASGAGLSPADPLYIRPPDAVTQADAEAARRAKRGE